MDISFEGFDGRGEALAKIMRWGSKGIMYHRTNVLLHTLRVYVLLQDAAPFIKKACPFFNLEFAGTLALVHDDPKIITGDVKLSDKVKMSSEELQRLHQEELAAIEKLVKRWPKKINGFGYKDLLYAATYKEEAEAQVVSLLDKIDAYCEILHELHAGNWLFVDNAKNISTEVLRELPKKYRSIANLFPSQKHPLLSAIPDLNIKQILADSRKHTPDSINKSTGILQYDRWRQLTAEYFGIDKLVKQKYIKNT